MTTMIVLIWAGCVIFLGGAGCGMLAAWRRYRNAIEDRDAQAKRDAEAIAGYMTRGVEFNQNILALLQIQNSKPRQVSVDWELLTQAANGAGYTLVKTQACDAAHAVN